jgi:2'-5' RNA ligase
MRPAITKNPARTKKNSAGKELKYPELLFIIAPPPHICSDVAVLKDDVHYLIGHTFADRFSKAHISLFRYSDEHADDMIRFVEEKAGAFQPFNVFLKDFGVFQLGSGRSIYMDIVNKYAIREIFESLVKEASDFTPHISIARNLSDVDFLKCWPYMKELKYSNQHFVCDRITVLIRHENKWVHYQEIPFGE